MEEAVRVRLNEMRNVTPLGALPLMNAFERVCIEYYERGGTFVQLLYDAFMGHMFDQFMTDFEAEEHWRLPSLNGGEPEYWRDAEAVFKGFHGELYPFTPMLTVNLSAFSAAYIFEGGGAAGPSSGMGVWRNDMLEAWTLGISLAQNNEGSRLNEIKWYALERYEPWSPTLINERLGRRYQCWGNRCKWLKARVYEEKHWQWVFDAFEIRGRDPDFLKELEDEYND